MSAASHDHDHHDHDHDHRPAHEHVHEEFNPREKSQAKKLGFVLALITVFFGVELGGAVLAKSNVLKADALHLLMDVMALSMSLLAMRVAVRRPTARFTFGLRRAEPVAAILNGTLVLLATGEIVRRGVLALIAQEPPEAGLMLVIALLALVVNGVSAWLLHGSHAHAHHDHKGHDLNVRGAKLHLLGDTLGSFAALIAALVIRFGGPIAADPIASFLVAIILFVGGGRLLRDAVLVLLEAAPPHLSVEAIRGEIRSFSGVVGVHDMHVWTLGAGHDCIVVHVHAAKSSDAKLGPMLAAHLRKKFKIEYVTVQVENDDTCGAPPSRYEDP